MRRRFRYAAASCLAFVTLGLCCGLSDAQSPGFGYPDPPQIERTFVLPTTTQYSRVYEIESCPAPMAPPEFWQTYNGYQSPSFGYSAVAPICPPQGVVFNPTVIQYESHGVILGEAWNTTVSPGDYSQFVGEDLVISANTALPPSTADAANSTAEIELLAPDTSPSPSDIRLDETAAGHPTPADVLEDETVPSKELVELKQELDKAITRARSAEERAYASEKSARAATTVAEQKLKALRAKVAAMNQQPAATDNSAPSKTTDDEVKKLKMAASLLKSESEQQKRELNAKIIVVEQQLAAANKTVAKEREQLQLALRKLADAELRMARNREDANAESKAKPESTAKPDQPAAPMKSVAAKNSSAKFDPAGLPDTLQSELELKLKESSDRIRRRFANQRRRLIESGAKESSTEITALDEKLAAQLEKNEAKIRSSHAEKIKNRRNNNKIDNDE